MFSKTECNKEVCRRKKRETHPILRSEYSIIEGEEEFIPYLTQLEQPKKKREMER